MDYPLTYIHPDAKIAEGVEIGPFTTIQKNVEIGKGTWIGPNVSIMEGARIGENCQIHPGAVVSNIPQDLKFKGEETITIIGDNTVIRECVTVNRGTTDKNETVVGSNVLLMAYVHIAHDCIIGDSTIIANAVQVAGHVEIGTHVVIGGSTAIRQFVKVGAHVLITGGSLVRKDIPPYVKAAREPLSYCGINSIGLKRRGFDADEVHEAQEVYRYLYSRGYNNATAIQQIESEMKPSTVRDEVLAFLRKSDLGIIRGYQQ